METGPHAFHAEQKGKDVDDFGVVNAMCGEHLGHKRRGECTLAVVEIAQHRLPQWMQRRTRVAWHTLEEEQPVALEAGSPAHLVQDARLANAGFALDHDDLATSRNGFIPTFTYQLGLIRAVDQGAGEASEREETVYTPLVAQRLPDLLGLREAFDDVRTSEAKYV